MLDNVIGERIKSLRTKKKESQDTFAKAIGVTHSALSAYELGKRVPGRDTLLSIAEYCGVSSEYLLGYTDKEMSYRNMRAHMTEQGLPQLRDILSDYLFIADASEVAPGIIEYFSDGEVEKVIDLLLYDDNPTGTKAIMSKPGASSAARLMNQLSADQITDVIQAGCPKRKMLEIARSLIGRVMTEPTDEVGNKGCREVILT